MYVHVCAYEREVNVERQMLFSNALGNFEIKTNHGSEENND